MEPMKISYHGNKEETMSIRVFNVGYEQCRQSYQWGPGQKDIYLLHYIVSGRGTYRVGGITYELGQGELFLSYPGVEISYQADKEDPWTYYWVGFQGNDAGAICFGLLKKNFNDPRFDLSKNIRCKGHVAC